jgi:hypothetical protein
VDCFFRHMKLSSIRVQLKGNKMKSINCLLALGSVLLSLTANSQSANLSVFDSLKVEPATKYDVGKLALNMFTTLLSQGITGQKIQGTSFEFQGVGIDEGASHLNILLQLEGKAQDMNAEQCTEFKEILGDNSKFSDTAKLLWADLSEADYEALKPFVGLSIVLISKENESFKIHC